MCYDGIQVHDQQVVRGEYEQVNRLPEMQHIMQSQGEVRHIQQHLIKMEHQVYQHEQHHVQHIHIMEVQQHQHVM